MIKERHLPQPGDFMKEWEETHLQAPAFRQEYEALRNAWDCMKDHKPDHEWWDEYMPAFVWLQSHGGSTEAFDELGDIICQECMARFLPRIHDYSVLLRTPKVQARMDGKTLYHVKKVISGVLETHKKSKAKSHK